ncbi:MAG: FecR family protein [Verrucomicrobiia bacterium]
MKPSPLTLLSLLLLLSTPLPLLAQQGGKPLQSAEITTIVNEVRVVKPQAAPQPAKLNEVIRPNEGVLTGPQSRAELLFADRTLARLGANTQFTFIPGSRTTEIQQGTMLLQVPKGAGGAQVKTAAVTAAVTGTTIMVEFFPGMFVKIIVLEGTLRVSLTNRLGESLLLTPGKMLIMNPDATRLPDPVDVDLKKLIKTSKLISGMGDSDELSNELIDQEVANQQQQKKKGNLIDTNIIILGSGTDAFLTDLDLLAAIEQAIDSRFFSLSSGNGGGGPGPIPPAPPPPSTVLNTITHPDPFPLGPDSVVSTNPTITNSLGTFQGATYTTNGSTDMEFLFGSSSPNDDLLGANDDNPPTTLAAFRFTNLNLIGDPIITTTGGSTRLALIAENSLTVFPATYTFSGLDEIIFGAGNSITVPSGAVFNNPALALNFYARNSGSNVTFLGQANTEALQILAANDFTFGPGASFTGVSFLGDALGSIMIDPSTITASSDIDLIANGNIFINPGASLSTSLAFLEAGGQITLSGSSLTASFADLAANQISLSGTFATPLQLFAQSGGVTGAATFLDLRTLTTVLGGSVNAGFIQSSAPLGTLWNVAGELISTTSILASNVDISADGINFGTGSFNGRNVTIFGLSSGLGLQGVGGITANDIVALSLPITAGGTINANSIFAGSVTSNLAGINVTNNLTASNLNAAANVTVGGNLNVGSAITVTGTSTVSAANMSLNSIQTSNLSDDVTYLATGQISLTSVGGPGQVTLDAPSLFLNDDFNSSDVLSLTSGATTLSQLTINGFLALNFGVDDFSGFTTLVLNGGAAAFSTSTFIPATSVFSADTLFLDILGNGPDAHAFFLTNPGTTVSFNQANYNGTASNPNGGTLEINSPIANLANSTDRMGPINLNGFDVATGTGGNGGSFTLNSDEIAAPSGSFAFTLNANGGNSSNGNGGQGGLASFTSTHDFIITTTTVISARGGDGTGTSANGGHGGGIGLVAAGTLSTAGLFFQLDATGGSGSTNGGNGGSINVSGANGVDLGANSYLLANSLGGSTGDGGNAGTINISSTAGSISIGGFSEIYANGGDTFGAGQFGGTGGAILISSNTGDLIVGDSTLIFARGGDASAGTGGAGGSITLNATGGTIDLQSNQTLSAGNGTGGVNNGTGGTVDLNAQQIKVGSIASVTIQTHSGTESADGGTINLNALRTTGQAISIENSSQLRALAAAAAANGGQINVISAGGDIDINGTLEASGGTSVQSMVLVRNDGPNGVINLTNSTLSADILKVGAISPNGMVNINGGSFTATDTLKIYGGSASNGVYFTANTTLDGAAAKHLAGHTVQINNGVTVTVSGPAVNVYTSNPNYSGFGGNGSTTGTFAGSGANLPQLVIDAPTF